MSIARIYSTYRLWMVLYTPIHEVYKYCYSEFSSAVILHKTYIKIKKQTCEILQRQSWVKLWYFEDQDPVYRCHKYSSICRTRQLNYLHRCGYERIENSEWFLVKIFRIRLRLNMITTLMTRGSFSLEMGKNINAPREWIGVVASKIVE